MFAVYRSSEKPGKEKREYKGDFQAVLEKASFGAFISLNHLFEGEDCVRFCCSSALPSNLTAEEGKPVSSSKYTAYLQENVRKLKSALTQSKSWNKSTRTEISIWQDGNLFY